jgi:glucose-1-phosphate thymidylyltransferase
MIERGIILAGGAGSRLYPLSKVASKQLQPVFDKPMIYYPLSTLMLGGVRDICIISTPQDIGRFEQLMGDGSQWGLKLTYLVQPEPNGIAQAFLISREQIHGHNVALILGDNIFYGQFGLPKIFSEFSSGGTVFAYQVSDPERYGVVEFDANGKVLSIEEKPKQPKSNFAVPGLYLYDPSIIEVCENLKPSARGELEITDVNVEYLKRGQLNVATMGRGIAWLDAGTSSSLHESSTFVQVIESRQGVKIGCPEEIALNKKFVTPEFFAEMIGKLPKCEYREYLERVLKFHH